MADISEIEVLVLGDSSVGKSAFLSRLSRGPHYHGVEPRDIDQPFIFDIRFARRVHRFEFSDTASPTSWTLMTPDAIILCYDISSRSSLMNLQRKWIKAVHSNITARGEVALLVLGLKRDLRSEEDVNGVIYPQEGLRVSQELRCDRYMECSSQTGELFDEVIEDICKTAIEHVTPDAAQGYGNCTTM